MFTFRRGNAVGRPCSFLRTPEPRPAGLPGHAAARPPRLLRHRLLPQPGGCESLGRWVSHHREHHSVTDREDAAIAIPELTARAALRSKPVIDDGHDLITPLDQLRRLEDPVVKACAQISRNPLKRFASLMGASPGSVLECDFEVWVSFPKRGVPVVPVKRAVHTADDLHVLLRHRLLPQPDGFAGFVFLVVQVDLDPRYQTVLVKGPNGPGDDIQLDPAGRPSGRDELSPQNRPVCDDNGFERFDHLLLKRVWLHPASQALGTPVWRLIPWRDEHDLAMDQREGTVEVIAATADGFEPATRGLHVSSDIA